MYDIYTKCSASSIMHQDVDNNNYTLVLIFDDVLEKKKVTCMYTVNSSTTNSHVITH